MKLFVLKQMSALCTALSGNTNVDALLKKALYFDHFWNSCAGIVFALRVLGFSRTRTNVQLSELYA
jgi:hypothetical protein